MRSKYLVHPGVGEEETESEVMKPTLIVLLLMSAEVLGNFKYFKGDWENVSERKDVFSGPSPGSFHPNLYCADSCREHWGLRRTNPGPSLQVEKKTGCPIMAAGG